MARIVKARGLPMGDSDTYIPDVLPEVFVDGVGEFLFSATHVKMTLFQVRPSPPKDNDGEGAIEHRQASHVLTMPLLPAIETFTKLLEALRANRAALGRSAHEYGVALGKSLEQASANTSSSRSAVAMPSLATKAARKGPTRKDRKPQ